MESLLLFRRAFSSPTMCRFIPALSVTGFCHRFFVVTGFSSTGFSSSPVWSRILWSRILNRVVFVDRPLLLPSRDGRASSRSE
jgi:glycine/D-amino acid oxidase-like deaminating enzyme